MKLKYYFFIIIMIFAINNCREDGGDDGGGGTPAGKSPPGSTGEREAILDEDPFYCRVQSWEQNPCELVWANYGKLQITVTGTKTKWKQVAKFESTTFPNPTSIKASPGTSITWSSYISMDGCIKFDIPLGEDYNIEILFIEGESTPCSPSSGEGCWRWKKSITIPEHGLENKYCGGMLEHKFSIWSTSPSAGSCTY